MCAGGGGGRGDGGGIRVPGLLRVGQGREGIA